MANTNCTIKYHSCVVEKKYIKMVSDDQKALAGNEIIDWHLHDCGKENKKQIK